MKTISKKTMRAKDFKSLAKKKSGYLQFKGAANEILFRTNRGWFLQTINYKKQEGGKTIKEQVIGEISVTSAQKWLYENGMNYSTGW